MLYLFDLDNTLISGYMDNADKHYDRWHLLPGRRERLQKLLAERHAVAIITNQGGVAWGLVSPEQMLKKIAAAVQRLGLPDDTPVFVAYHDRRGRPPYNMPSEAERRKPASAMLREAMAALPGAAAAGVLMVGDRREDQAAARNAGVDFAWADDFFGH